MKKILCDICGNEIVEHGWEKLILRNVYSEEETLMDVCVNYSKKIQNRKGEYKTRACLIGFSKKFPIETIKFDGQELSEALISKLQFDARNILMDSIFKEIETKYIPIYKTIIENGGQDDKLFLIASRDIMHRLQTLITFTPTSIYSSKDKKQVITKEIGMIRSDDFWIRMIECNTPSMSFEGSAYIIVPVVESDKAVLLLLPVSISIEE